MSKKITKSIALTGAATLGGLLSQTANADQLDDAIVEAKNAGFETDVTTKTVTVSTKAEADKLNQDEAARIQTLAENVRSAAEQVKSTDKYVEKLRDGIQSAQRAAESEQVDTNSKVLETANIDYDKRIKAIEENNRKLEAEYKAKKAQIDEENRKLEAEYQREKTKVDLKNQEEQNKYIAALAKAKADEANYQKALAEYTAKKQSAEEIREKRFSDETLAADAEKAGVGVELPTLVDKGTVSESDLAKLAAEYETAKAEVRKTLAEVAAQNAEAAKTIRDEQNTTRYANEQKQIVQEKVDADNNDLGTANNITTNVREEQVTGADASLEAVKAAYERIKENLDDNHIRTLADATAYFKNKGLSDEEAAAKAQDLIGTNALEKITEYKTRHSKDAVENGTSEYAKFIKALKGAGVTVNYKDIHKTVGTLPIDAKLSDTTNPAVTTYKNAISELDAEIANVYAKNPDTEVTQLLKSIMNNPAEAAKSKVTLSNNYAADLEEYNKVREAFEKFAKISDAYKIENVLANPQALKDKLNSMLLESAGKQYAFTANSITNSHGGYNNQNNMSITRSSDKVKYLQTPDLSSGTYDYNVFDIMNDRPTSDTPVFNQMLDTEDNTMMDYTLVRIPKGESVTVTYTLKDGGSYDQSQLNATGLKLFERSLVDAGGTVTLTNSNAKDVKSIEMRITNNNAVGTGDMVVAVRNNTAEPFAVGVANGDRNVRKPWTLINNSPSMTFDYTIDADFKSDTGDYLVPAMNQYEVTETPHRYNDVVMGSDINIEKGSTYKPLEYGGSDYEELALWEESPIHMENAGDEERNSSKLKWDFYAPARVVAMEKPNYRDTNRWLEISSYASPRGRLTSSRKTYDKRLVEWGARDDVKNRVKMIDKGSLTGSDGYSGPTIPNIPTLTIKPKPVEPPTEITLPNASLELTREVVVPTVKQLPAVASEPVGIRPVVWKVKYKGTFEEPEPKKPEGEPVKPTVHPYPDKPVLKVQPEPPKKEVIPQAPEKIKIAASANSLALKARIANKPKMTLERMKYVAENRFSSGNTLVVRGIDKTRRASSGNSLVVRTLSGSYRV